MLKRTAAKVKFRAIAAFTLLAFSLGAGAAEPPASQSFSREENQIPRNPTAPPSLYQQAPPDSFRCERIFVHRKKALDCDSNVQQDGERLRPVLQSTPAAIRELDLYQRNRHSLRNVAYMVSAGVAVTLASVLFVKLTGDHSIRYNGQSLKPVAYGIFAGLGFAVGSFIYGVSLSKTNESHLGNAVQEYNKTHSTTPIELQFSTGISF
jgi:hypothetical protein